MSTDTLASKPLYTTAEVTTILQVSRPTLYRLFQSGSLKKVKLGSGTRVRHADLVAYIDSLTDNTNPIRTS